MRRLGVHISIAGGLHLSLKRAHVLGCSTMQIFIHNPRAWATKPIEKKERYAFKKSREKFDINPIYSHASYLINIASPDRALRDMSVRLLREEIERADCLGIDYVVLHTGVAYDPKGKYRAASSIKKALGSRKSGARLLLENTAGKKGDIGSNIEDMAWLIEYSGGRIAGICMDSCHAFAAGYDIRDAVGIKKLSGEIGKYIGFEAVKLIHLNDSKGEAGSRIDRHEHIGRGKIGRVALKCLITHRPFLDIPVVLETPKRSNDDDIENLSIVRAMLAG
jgi:deoxyribonuclease-4